MTWRQAILYKQWANKWFHMKCICTKYNYGGHNIRIIFFHVSFVFFIRGYNLGKWFQECMTCLCHSIYVFELLTSTKRSGINPYADPLSFCFYSIESSKFFNSFNKSTYLRFHQNQMCNRLADLLHIHLQTSHRRTQQPAVFRKASFTIPFNREWMILQAVNFLANIWSLN